MSPTAMPPVFVGHRPKSLMMVHGVKSNLSGGIWLCIQPGYEVKDMYLRAGDAGPEEVFGAGELSA